MREEFPRVRTMQREFTEPTDHRAKGCGAAGDVSFACKGAFMFRTRMVQVVSQFAELSVFFAAAAALGAGVIFLR